MLRGRMESANGIIAVILLMTAPVLARPDTAETSSPVRLTLEIEWTFPKLPSLPGKGGPELPAVEMEAQGGRILQATSWSDTDASDPELLTNGAWRLGNGVSGRVRARIEALPGSNVIVRIGAHATAFPINALIEGPQCSAAGAPATILMKRLPWDTLEIEMENDDGLLEPGAAVPITVGFNVLTAETTEGTLTLVGILRPAHGGNPIARFDQVQNVASNPAPRHLPAVVLQATAPRQEGLYVLDLQAEWKSATAPEGSRLSRLIHRRKSSEPIVVQASRHVTLAVMDPKPTGMTSLAAAPGTVVDSMDLTRPGRHRGMASGRAAVLPGGHEAWPVPDVSQVRADLGDRLRGLVGLGPETATLAPADGAGLAWSAVGLNVAHVDKPHRLTLTIASGDPSALAVGLIAPGDGAQKRPKALLDSTGSGAVVGPNAKPTICSWLVWPTVNNPVLVLVHRGANGPVRLGSVTLEEVPETAAAAPVIPAAREPRMIGLVVPSATDLERFGSDVLAQGRNLASYMEHVGTTVAVVPTGLHERDHRRELDGQADESSLAPDRLELLLRTLEDRGLSALVEIHSDGLLPGLPPASSVEARQRGLVRLDGRGQAVDPPSYNPLHPEVRAALAHRVETALAPRRRHPNLLGGLVRLGPGATLAGPADTGLDDAGYARFVSSMLEGEVARRVPGLDNADSGRFEARRQYITGPGKMPWMTWRSRQIGDLYGSLADTAEHVAPGAIFAVVTPLLDQGCAGRAARSADALGESPRSAWQSLGLDFDQWPGDRPNLLVLRGVSPGNDPLSRDLATHPDLDACVAKMASRGSIVLTSDEPAPVTVPLALVAARPLAVEGELLGHALAVLDSRWSLLDLATITGREAEIVSFARVFRSLPTAGPTITPLLGPETGVAARAWAVEGRTIFGLANDSPYTIRVEATYQASANVKVDDLGRNLRLQPESSGLGQRLVIELPAFGVSAIRLSEPDVHFESVRLQLPEDVVATQYKVLSARLSRLTQEATEPINVGFEPIPGAPDAPGNPAGSVVRTAAATVPCWSASGEATVAIDSERPHNGQGSLRLEARTTSSTMSEWFSPPGGTVLDLRVWLRADRPETKASVWIEAESAGKSNRWRAEVVVQPEWAEQPIRISNLPATGVDRMRLRFELTAPGQLWIDDLTLSGQRPSESALRAQRQIVAAMQKYRERHYADFARIAESYWARVNDGTWPARTGVATDLPLERRLR